MEKTELVRLALEARTHSYAPYSKFRVGAALLTTDGAVYQGANAENASYGATICAERAAAMKAVYDGRRRFAAIAVAGFTDGGERGWAHPCGICRQFLREFAAPGMKIYVAKTETELREYTLEELLPESFGPENLEMS